MALVPLEGAVEVLEAAPEAPVAVLEGFVAELELELELEHEVAACSVPRASAWW